MSENSIDSRKSGIKIRTIIIQLLLLACSTSTYAQENSGSLDDTVQVRTNDISVTAPPVMAKKWNQVKTKYFTLNIGLAFDLDHNIVLQDENNVQQVGKVDPGTEFRADRLIFTGNLLLFKNPWRYMVSANYNGLDAPQGSKKFSFIDWNIDIPVGKRGGWVTVGKQKEGVGYEYIAPGSQLIFTERGSGVPALVRQRNIGFRYSNIVLKERLFYTIGAYNNYWETGKSFTSNGSQIVARVVYLPEYKSDRELLHVGVAYRYSDATEGQLSYKGKPEANTAPSYFSTGAFAASSSNTAMLELIKVQGPVSFIGEYMENFVKTPDGNRSFNYMQVGGSWFITGENRRYNKQSAVLGKLIPKKNFNFKKNPGTGAFELGARYTYANFDDQNISGGKFGRFTGAFSWYPNAHFRLEVNYGNGSLEKSKLTGKAEFWQLRLQFEL